MQVYSYKKNSGLIFLIVLQVFDIAAAAKGGFQSKNQPKDSFSGSNPMIAATSEKPVVQQELVSGVVNRSTSFLRDAPYIKKLQSQQQARQLESVGSRTRFSSDQSYVLKKSNTQTGSSGLEISGDQTGQITASGNVVQGFVQVEKTPKEKFNSSLQLDTVRESGDVVAYDNPMYIPSLNKTLVKQESAQVKLKPRASGWINPLSSPAKGRSQNSKSGGKFGIKPDVVDGVLKANDGPGVEQKNGDGGQVNVGSEVDVSKAQEDLLMEKIYPENIESVSVSAQLKSSSQYPENIESVPVSAQLKSSSHNPLSRAKGRSQVSKSSVGVKPDVVEGVSKANDALVVEQTHGDGGQGNVGSGVDVSKAQEDLFMGNIYPDQKNSGSAEKNSQFAESNYSNLSKNLAQLHISFQDFVDFIFNMSVAAKNKFLQYLEKNFSSKSSTLNENQESSVGTQIIEKVSQLPKERLSQVVEQAEGLISQDAFVVKDSQSQEVLTSEGLKIRG